MKKLDKLFQQVEFFEKMAIYGDRKSFLKSLAQNQSVEPTYTANPASSEPNQSVAPAPQAPIGPPTEQPYAMPEKTVMPYEENQGQVAYRPIDKGIQRMLNQMFVQNGEMLPIKEDGKLGPETRKALELYKTKYNRPATSASVSQTFNQYFSNYKEPKEPGAPIEPGQPHFPIGNTKQESDPKA